MSFTFDTVELEGLIQDPNKRMENFRLIDNEISTADGYAPTAHTYINTENEVPDECPNPGYLSASAYEVPIKPTKRCVWKD